MSKKVNLTKDEQIALEEQAQCYLEKEGNGYYHREYAVTFEYDRCVVEIIWGDWKHDHIWCKNTIEKFLNNKGFICDLSTDITEENDSDAYSAIHYFDLTYKD